MDRSDGLSSSETVMPASEWTNGLAMHPTQSASTTVFGLDVRSIVPLGLLARSSGISTGRALELSIHESASELDWPASAELICDEHQSNGDSIYRVEAHPESGYFISGPEYGDFLLSADGRKLRCAPEGRPEGAWQRLLIAQALPFAALLQGLEVFHASAVVVPNKSAVAFLGPSRAGKTSVALELCRRGASFLTDDVLALECVEDKLLGHPGTPVAGLDHAEARRLAQTGERLDEKTIAVNDRERLVPMHGATEPAPLAGLFFLDRRTNGPARPRFEPVADAQMLLAATFNFVLATPERLRGLLEVCALAARLRVERIVSDPGTSVGELVAAVEQRLDSPA